MRCNSMKKHSIKNQWDDAAEAWVDFARTGKDWTREELNNPAMFEMLRDIHGKKILDLGCGEGCNSRLMAGKGAKVIGIDFSKKMIDFAVQKEKKEKLGITYYVLDACNLHIFKNNTFDTVTCFMALQDIKNYQDAIKEVFRVLRKHGRFIFVIPHPCFERRIIGNKIIGGWECKKGTKDKSSKNLLYYKPKNPLYYKVDKYFDTHSYIIPWTMNRLTKHFRTTTFHRTLTDYADALHNAGLVISKLNEPKPTKRGLAKYPAYFKGNLRIPQSIVIEAMKY